MIVDRKKITQTVDYLATRTGIKPEAVSYTHLTLPTN